MARVRRFSARGVINGSDEFAGKSQSLYRNLALRTALGRTRQLGPWDGKSQGDGVNTPYTGQKSARGAGGRVHRPFGSFAGKQQNPTNYIDYGFLESQIVTWDYEALLPNNVDYLPFDVLVVGFQYEALNGSNTVDYNFKTQKIIDWDYTVEQDDPTVSYVNYPAATLTRIVDWNYNVDQIFAIDYEAPVFSRILLWDYDVQSGYPVHSDLSPETIQAIALAMWNAPAYVTTGGTVVTMRQAVMGDNPSALTVPKFLALK